MRSLPLPSYLHVTRQGESLEMREGCGLEADDGHIRQCKTKDILFAKELAKRYGSYGLVALSLYVGKHPGLCLTESWRMGHAYNLEVSRSLCSSIGIGGEA